jgi:hypothetical protein
MYMESIIGCHGERKDFQGIAFSRDVGALKATSDAEVLCGVHVIRLTPISVEQYASYKASPFKTIANYFQNYSDQDLGFCAAPDPGN